MFSTRHCFDSLLPPLFYIRRSSQEHTTNTQAPLTEKMFQWNSIQLTEAPLKVNDVCMGRILFVEKEIVGKNIRLWGMNREIFYSRRLCIMLTEESPFCNENFTFCNESLPVCNESFLFCNKSLLYGNESLPFSNENLLFYNENLRFLDFFLDFT